MLTLQEWTEKQTNPAQILYPVLSDVDAWADLPNTFTADMIYTYLLHKYRSVLMFDYNISDLTALITIWNEQNRYKFDGLSATTKLTYNPIENYNRTETETSERTPDITWETGITETPSVVNTQRVTRTPNVTETDTHDLTRTETPRVATSQQVTHTPNTTETETHNLLQTEGGTTGNTVTGTTTGTSGATGKIAPFDSAVFNNATQNDVTATDTESKTETTTHGKTIADTGTVTRQETGTDTTRTITETPTGTNTTADTGTLTRRTAGTDTTETVTTPTGTNTTDKTETETGTDTTERTAHVSGNIGVTTSQQMIEQERAVVNFAFLDYYLHELITAFGVGVFSVDIWEV